MKDIAFSTDIEFLEAEPLEKNPMLSKVKIRIAQTGRNRNMSVISKETLERAAEKSLGLTPIVGYYNHYTGDFGEHGQQAVFDDRGNLVTIADTVAFGVVPENPVIYWEDDYLVTYGYLWTERYPEIQEATKGRPQSMELSQAHTVIEPIGDGYVEILDTAFTGLCILGADVTPCFEEASIKGLTYSYIATDEEKGVDKEMSSLMKSLKFALENDFDDNKFIVDEEGAEKNREVRETITDAINTLDEIAEVEESENQDVIDDSITKLVDAETELAGEVKIIPKDTDVVEDLQGEPSREDGVVSTETATYKSSNSLLRKNKTKEEREVEEMAKKKKEDEVVVKQPVEEKVAPVAEEKAPEEAVAEPVEKQEVPVAEDEAAAQTAEGEPAAVTEASAEGGEIEPLAEEGAGVPGDEGEVTEVAETKGVTPGTDLAVEPTEGMPSAESTENPFGEPENTPVQEGIEGQGVAQPESEMVQPQRKTAEDRRKEAVLDSISDEELSDHLIGRVEEAERVKENIAKLAGTTKEAIDPTNVPQEEVLDENGMPVEESPEEFNEEATPSIGEEEADAVEEESLESEKDDKPDFLKEDNEEEEAPIEPSKDTEEKEEVPTEDEEKEEEDLAPEDEDEDEKKKKKNFSLDFKEIVAENVSLRQKVNQLETERKELLVFKLEAEKTKKEALLAEFSISEKAKENIRSEFAKLSLEQIEEKAAVVFYREMKELANGQKEVEDSIEFSLDNEVEKPKSGLQAILDKAAESLDDKF